MTKTPLHRLATILIAGVWIFHGLYSKILNGIPRHKMIVGEILGETAADAAVIVIGVLEILLGIWVLSGLLRRLNATVQTLALVSMNTLEILFAREHLISAPGMVFLNLCFITFIWWRAITGVADPSLPRSPPLSPLDGETNPEQRSQRQPDPGETPMDGSLKPLPPP